MRLQNGKLAIICLVCSAGVVINNFQEVSALAPNKNPERAVFLLGKLRNNNRSTKSKSSVRLSNAAQSTLPPPPPSQSQVEEGSKDEATNNVSPAALTSQQAPDNSLSTDAKKFPFTFPMTGSELQLSISVFGGTLLTFWLNNFLNLGPVLGSSVTALLSTLVLSEKMALAALCGSFAGMAKTTVISATVGTPYFFLPATLLAVLCSSTLGLFDKQKWLIGVGGRLGFVAQCACTFQFILSSLFLSSFMSVFQPSAKAALFGSFSIRKAVVQFPSVAVCTVAGALFMSVWKDVVKQIENRPSQQSEGQGVVGNMVNSIQSFLKGRLSNSVAAVGATGLIAAVLAPPSIAGPAFCGSFIAMSSPAKLATYGALVGASVWAAVFQQVMSGALLGGWGGKLGTAALLGVVAYNTVRLPQQQQQQ